MTQDINKIMAMLGGQSSAEYTRSCLTAQDQSQINNAIEILFSGFSLRNWLSGDTLGGSWTVALDSVRDIVFSFSEVNPATIFARQATFDHRRKWHTKIIMSADADEKMHCSDVQCSELIADADTKIQNGIAMLRAKISEFNTPRAHQTAPVSQMTKLHVINAHVREQEHERERTK